MANLQKEIWVNQIKENFYPDSSFLNYAKDFSGLVENHAINMAEAGVDPKVLINNTMMLLKSTQLQREESLQKLLFHFYPHKSCTL